MRFQFVVLVVVGCDSSPTTLPDGAVPPENIQGSCDGWWSGEGYEGKACIEVRDDQPSDAEYACKNNWVGAFTAGGRCTGDAMATCTTLAETIYLLTPRAGSEQTWRRICEEMDRGAFATRKPIPTTDPPPAKGAYTTLTGPVLGPDFAHITKDDQIWFSAREDIMSDDGGPSWRKTAAFPGSYRRWTFFLDANKGFIIDESCEFRATIDGGKTWTTQSNATGGGCLGVVFAADALHGFAPRQAGGIATTTDGGKTWTLQATSITIALNMIALRSDKLAWAVGSNGTILQTTDGSTWPSQTSNTSVSLRAVDAVDDLVAIAVGDAGTVVRTIDGGTTWTPVTKPTSASLISVDFLSSTEGWVGSADGVLYHTQNGGTAWDTRPLLDARVAVGAVHATGANTATVAALDTLGKFWATYKTADGGASWKRAAFGASLGALAFSGAVGAAGGLSGILITKDSGATWQRTAFPEGASAITFAEPNYLVAFGGNPHKSYTSIDSGKNWLPTSGSLGDAVGWTHFFDAATGWAVTGTQVYSTTNGGSTWTGSKKADTPNKRGFVGAQFWSTDAISVADGYVGLVTTTDQAATWSAGMSRFLSATISGVSFADAQVGYMTTSITSNPRKQCDAYLTGDGGKTFRLSKMPLSMASAPQIIFLSAGLGVGLGPAGIQLTRDGGASWATANSFRATRGEMVGPSEVWLVGQDGLGHGVNVGE